MGRQIGDFRADRLLTNMSQSSRNPESSYIAGMCFPAAPQDDYPSGIIPKYEWSDNFRDGAQVRGLGTKSEGFGSGRSRGTYMLDRYSFRDEYYDDEVRGQQDPYNLDVDTTEYVTDKLWIRREIEFSDRFMKDGVWTGLDEEADSADPLYKPWNESTANPLKQIAHMKYAVEGKIAQLPSVTVMGSKVELAAMFNPNVIDAVKYTQKGVVDGEQFASLARIQKLMVGRALRVPETTPMGTVEGSVALERIFPNHVLTIYVPQRPSRKTPAAGYTFTLQMSGRIPGVKADALQWIKRMRDEEREATIIEANSYWQMQQLEARAGAFLKNAVAADD